MNIFSICPFMREILVMHESWPSSNKVSQILGTIPILNPYRVPRLTIPIGVIYGEYMEGSGTMSTNLTKIKDKKHHHLQAFSDYYPRGIKLGSTSKPCFHYWSITRWTREKPLSCSYNSDLSYTWIYTTKYYGVAFALFNMITSKFAKHCRQLVCPFNWN
mgnify:CR=1 FL=1